MGETERLHYKYAIGILIIAFIELIAYWLYPVPDLVGRIEFALALCSLVLSIVAIFYTIITGKSQSDQLAQIGATNKEISQSASDIKESSTQLSLLLQQIPGHFVSMNDKIDNIPELMKEFGMTLKSKSSDDLLEEDDDQSAISDLTDKYSEIRVPYINFINRLYSREFKFIYLVFRAYNNQVAISFKMLYEILSDGTAPFFSFLSVMLALDLIEIELTNDLVYIRQLHEPLKSYTLPVFDKLKDSLGNVWRDNEAKHIKEIDALMLKYKELGDAPSSK